MAYPPATGQIVERGRESGEDKEIQSKVRKLNSVFVIERVWLLRAKKQRVCQANRKQILQSSLQRLS